MNYLQRALDLQLDQLLPHVGAIAIEGIKGSGKTETATRRSALRFNLDLVADQELLSSDPSFSAFKEGTLLIDEWQKMPESWDMVRRAVDNKAPKGRFLLTGSATPKKGTDTHSGAGRILSLRMRPLALFEREGAQPTISMAELLGGDAPISGESESGLKDYAHAIASSGFPGFYQESPLVRKQQLGSFIQRIVDRDLPDQGYSVRDKDGLMKWLAAYAAASSTTANYSEILDAATPAQARKPSKATTIHYREKLAEIWMLDDVPAWDYRLAPFSNLAKSPKHQLADPAFVLQLLRVPENKLLNPQYSELFGALFESLATLTVRVAAQASFASVGHFRLHKGEREIDLIVQGQDGEIVPIEVKLSPEIKDHDVRNLKWLKEKLPYDVVDMVVLTTGTHAYRRADGVAVIPLALLGA